MTIVPLIDYLADAGKTNVTYKKRSDPDDLLWKQTVLDYQDEIKSTATAISVSAEVFAEVKFRMRAFYKRHGYSLQNMWIARIINPGLDDMTLTGELGDVIYIPSDSYILSLYQKYSTVKANS